jgi:hypothetical protein
MSESGHHQPGGTRRRRQGRREELTGVVLIAAGLLQQIFAPFPIHFLAVGLGFLGVLLLVLGASSSRPPASAETRSSPHPAETCGTPHDA